MDQHLQHAWYALRRTLVPWRFAEALEELVAFCTANHVDEVILKCDTEEFSHGLPTVAWLTAYQPHLFEARDALRAAGVAYSLNPWVTQGHIDRGRDIRGVFPGIQTLIGHDGAVTHGQACPLCPVWRDLTAQLWRLYAATEPRVIWVEDDIRTFNHLPARLSCFCPEHLRRFGALVGQTVTREELVAALLAPGAPHPWRAQWLRMQGDVMVETVRFLQETVHAVSPRTSLGLMSSGPDNHVCEGRRWHDFGHALGGPTPLFSRPPLGSYNEWSLRGLYYTAQSIRQTRHCLPPAVVEQTEVENWPFTQYSKSAVFTGLQMATSFAFGCEGVTLNLFDHVGTPLHEQAAFGRMLAEWKPFLAGLAERCGPVAPGQPKAPCAGIRLLHRDDFSSHRQLAPGADFYGLCEDAHGWQEILDSLGFPTTYDASPVTAVTGQILRACSPAEREALLTGGLLLDATAADTLCQLGQGDLIGATVADIVPKDDCGTPLAVEHWDDPDFGGEDDAYFTMTLPDLGGGARLARLQPQPGAEVVSHLLDPDRRVVMPYLTIFTNRLGGRVAIFPLVVTPGRFQSFLSPLRKRQFSRLLRWLAKDCLPFEVSAGGAYPLAFRRDREAHTLVGAFNLTLDPWDGVTFDLHRGSRFPDVVEALAEDGAWRPARVSATTAGTRLTVRVPSPVTFRRPVVFDITWT